MITALVYSQSMSSDVSACATRYAPPVGRRWCGAISGARPRGGAALRTHLPAPHEPGNRRDIHRRRRGARDQNGEEQHAVGGRAEGADAERGADEGDAERRNDDHLPGAIRIRLKQRRRADKHAGKYRHHHENNGGARPFRGRRGRGRGETRAAVRRRRARIRVGSTLGSR